MTTPETTIVNDLPPDDTDEAQSAYLSFLGVAAVGYVAILAFIFAFGLFGERMTAGIDDACAEASFQGGQKALTFGNYELAIRRFRRALEGQFPDRQREYDCGRSLCETLWRLERYDEAVDAYRALPAAALSEPGHFAAYASSLRRAGHAAEAERVARQWLDMASKANDATQQMWAYGTLGGICQDAKRLEDALGYYRAGAALGANSELVLNLAEALHSLGRDAEAVTELDGFVARVPMGDLRERAEKMRVQYGGTAHPEGQAS